MKHTHNAVVSGGEQGTKLHVSQDGYVRISSLELCSLSLMHFLSGLDKEADERACNDATLTSISGYTEWLWRSPDAPVITIGWDWHLDFATRVPRYVRDGQPRSNLMLVDTAKRQDLGAERTAATLITLIDHLDWESQLAHHLSVRYA